MLRQMKEDVAKPDATAAGLCSAASRAVNEAPGPSLEFRWSRRRGIPSGSCWVDSRGLKREGARRTGDCGGEKRHATGVPFRKNGAYL